MSVGFGVTWPDLPKGFVHAIGLQTLANEDSVSVRNDNQFVAIGSAVLHILDQLFEAFGERHLFETVPDLLFGFAALVQVFQHLSHVFGPVVVVVEFLDDVVGNLAVGRQTVDERVAIAVDYRLVEVERSQFGTGLGVHSHGQRSVTAFA